MSELEEGKPEEGLRNEVLASTAWLQQQLLEAMDKLQQGKSDQNELQAREILVKNYTVLWHCINLNMAHFVCIGNSS